MTSTSSNSPTSLPTTMAFLPNNKTDEYFCSFCTTNQDNFSISYGAMSVIILIFVFLLRWLIESPLELDTCREEIFTLKFKRDARIESLEEERKKSWAETYQKEAAHLVKIRDVASSLKAASGVPHDTVNFEAGNETATLIRKIQQLRDLVDDEFSEK